jgi:hypothetical protein
MLIALSIELEGAATTRLVVADELLDFWGDQYQALPAGARKRISFERFLILRIRNGALFEKIRCPRVQRRSSAAQFRSRKAAP